MNDRTSKVQVRSLGNMGNWIDVHPQRIEFEYRKYDNHALRLDGRTYRMPWRVIANDQIIHVSDVRPNL